MPDIPVRPQLYAQHNIDTYVAGDFGESLIYRRFKVSGGTNLDTLQDKIIQPIMGWERNAHAFVFTDLSDGACYGPRDSGAIDMMHVDKTCQEYIPTDEYKLAHLAQTEGTEFLYLYDFGDRWWHRIQVEKILPKNESDGSVTILEGRGQCPAEDCHGNLSYAKMLYKLAEGTGRQRHEVISEIQRALNYSSKGRISVATWDPKKFDIEAARGELAAALASLASARTGPKSFTTAIHPSAIDTAPGMFGPLKRGQEVVHKSGEDVGSFMSETVNHRRDRLKAALCALCGSPNNLKACSGCRKIFYCGSEHQKQDWPTHKPECRASRNK